MTTVVFEVNEIPFKVLEKYIKENPNSNLSKLSHRIITNAEDLPEDELYPSQTWASINTGKSFSEHKVKWFSDSIDHNQLYWNDLQKKGCRVSVIGSLHTSPASKFLNKDHNFVTFIPDFFSSDNLTHPKLYENFQKFNIEVTDENRRVSNLGLLLKALVSFLKNPTLKGWGLNNFLSIKQLFSIVFTSIFINKERLRLAQFVMSASIFHESLKKNSDLAIIFTNHVASMMHRYLHAYLETNDCPYDDKWKKKYKNEVSFSIDLLDEWLGKIIRLGKNNKFKIILLSSMGQKINDKIDQNHLNKFDHDYILKEPEKLLSALVENVPKFESKGVMVPQYSFQFESSEIAEELHRNICKLGTDENLRFGHYTKSTKRNNFISGFYINSDLNNDVVTLSIQLNSDNLIIKDKKYNFAEVGFDKFKSDNHHSGEHDKRGILWSNFEFSKTNEINYLEFRKIILKFID